MGEVKRKAPKTQKPVAVTPLGPLPFFIDFLKVSGVFNAWVKDCPVHSVSNNAPEKRAGLATFLLSIFVGHHRYTHIIGIREDMIHLGSLGSLCHPRRLTHRQ